MKCWLSVSVLAVSFLAGCGAYEKEQTIDPARYSIVQNHLTNSNFQFWQRGEVVEAKNGELRYGADRWYVKNIMGDESVITIKRVEPMAEGSVGAASVEVTDAPNRNEFPQSGAVLYQTLEASDTTPFIGKTASFSVLIRKVGITQKVGVQLMYATTERPVNEPLGTEQVFEVGENLTLASVQNVFIGKQIPRGGVLGVRIRVTQTDGFTYSRASGFIVEQAMLNVGTLSSDYRPRNSSVSDELRHCLRYYEKSYNIAVEPGTMQEPSAVFIQPKSEVSVLFTERKRPGKVTAEIYAPRHLKHRHHVGLVDNPGFGGAEIRNEGETGFTVAVAELPRSGYFHWDADAEIYDP